MKIFLDTANIDEIKRHSYIIDGVTTNPTLLAREGGNFIDTISGIMASCDGPVSVEIMSCEAGDIIKEAWGLSTKLSDDDMWRRLVVKIPVTEEGLRAVFAIEDDLGISTNVTLVFSVNQAILAAKAGASYASIFVGRLDDRGEDGMLVVRDTVEAYRRYGYDTKVIVASVRKPLHVTRAASMGADVCTVPTSVLVDMFAHSLTDDGIKRFQEDWKKVKK